MSVWQTSLLSLLAGAMGANATPHFVKGITKEAYPNVFGGSPVSNLVAGWAGLVLAALLTYWAHPQRYPLWSLAFGAVGVLLSGCLTHGTVSCPWSHGGNNLPRSGTRPGQQAWR
jgi:hypothetical protein